mmetsp:Transcript_55624/g.75934  ORF Transcript_55624/g.75934 Transcript_55624/m.75934 type:complete len:80 (-) Transcript_55624:338-577(-)
MHFKVARNSILDTPHFGGSDQKTEVPKIGFQGCDDFKDWQVRCDKQSNLPNAVQQFLTLAKAPLEYSYGCFEQIVVFVH